MNNSLLNGVLALLRNAPERAREYLRSPNSNVTSTSDVYIAIIEAIEDSNNKAKLECLRGILNRALRLDGCNEDYMGGVIDIEHLIEAEIDDLRAKTEKNPQGQDKET
jgi:hypothetical protein